MQFSNFSRSVSGNVIKLKNEIPIENVDKINYFTDDSTGSFSKKEVRWSFSASYWSAWQTLTQGALTSINTRGARFTFLEFRYVLASAGSGNASKMTVNFTRRQDTPVPEPCPTPRSDDFTKYEVVKITNANTLNGYPGVWYLNRANHIGKQSIATITGLQQIINDLFELTAFSIDNVTDSGVGVFSYSDGSTWWFKRIDGSGGINVSGEDSIIYVSLDPDALQGFVREASLGSDFVWNNGILEVSIGFDPSSFTSLSNVGSGTGEVFKGMSGNNAELRTLVSTTGVITVNTVGDQIRLGLDSSILEKLTWSDPDPVSATVGGILSGTDISLGEISINILEKILYEYFPPNIDLLLTPSSGYHEKWNPFVPTAEIFGTFDNTSFVKVRVTDISAYVSVNNAEYQPVSVTPTTISYPNVSDGSFFFEDGSFPNWEDVKYKIRVYHNINSTPMQPYDVSISLKFVEPYIWGIVDDTVDVNNITSNILQGFHSLGQKLIVPKQSNQINYERDSSMLKIKFVYAYPESYGKLFSIFDVVNDFNVTSSFDTSTRNIVIGASNPIPYKFYIKRHWINVEKFVLRFNI